MKLFILMVHLIPDLNLERILRETSEASPEFKQFLEWGELDEARHTNRKLHIFPDTQYIRQTLEKGV